MKVLIALLALFAVAMATDLVYPGSYDYGYASPYYNYGNYGYNNYGYNYVPTYGSRYVYSSPYAYNYGSYPYSYGYYPYGKK